MSKAVRHLPLFAVPLLLVASAAGAQTPPPAAEPLGGPLVPSVCLLSQQAVMLNAKVGVAASARLKVLADQAQTDLVAQRAPVEADAKTLEAQRATLKPADLQQRQQALGARVQALQQTASQRSRQIEATRQKVLGRIALEAQAVIAAIYKAKGCGLLVDRNSILGGNMGNDLTAAVVQGLDAKITTLSFDLETLAATAPVATRP